MPQWAYQNLVFFALAMMPLGAGIGNADVLMNAVVPAMENSRRTPLMNPYHATYSFGMAFSAIMVGDLRMLQLALFWIFSIRALFSTFWDLRSYEPDEKIENLEKEIQEKQKTKPKAWGGLLDGLHEAPKRNSGQAELKKKQVIFLT
ncbi:MAG: hypothetical protein ACI9O0_000730 [Paracoccaceae bacterium]